MKKILIVIGISIINCPLFGQILNQDADGKSSILALGGTLSLDVKESLVKASFNKQSYKAKSLIYGINVQGKNSEDGTAALFEGGNLNPQGEATLMIGGKRAWQKGAGSSRLYYYARAGVKAKQFKFDRGSSFTTIDSRFADTLQVSHVLEAGLSLRWGGQLHLGLLAGNSKEDNQDNLTKSVFKYQTTDPSLTGLQKTKDITAYSGVYGRMSHTYFNFDALYLIPLDTVVNYYAAPAIYFRYNGFSNQDLKKNNAILGISLNFINTSAGKFLGGVYFQTNDLFNEADKNFDNRIQFGLIIKINFAALEL